jgi:inner membrane protein
MDSLTQAVLGAGVAEVTLGRKIGNKALLIGAVIGTIPDLDVLFTGFYSEADGLLVHRGFSHSLVFSLLLSPLLALLLGRIFRKAGVSFRKWWLMAFLVLVTHPMLDMLTGYGTGFLEPLSGVRIEINSIAIIDVFYTLPFLTLLVALMFYNRDSLIRRRLGIWAISVSSAYLLLTLVHKPIIHREFRQSLESQQLDYHRLRTSPMPLTNFLWMGIAESDAGYYMGLYSVFDRKKNILFQYIPRNEYVIASYTDSHSLGQLKRFSKGYYSVTRSESDTLIFNDLRFGRMGFDRNDPFVFSFYLECGSSGCEVSRSGMTGRSFTFSAYLNRIFGVITPENTAATPVLTPEAGLSGSTPDYSSR